MIKAVIVEDNDAEAKILLNCISRYQNENDIKINIERFNDADSFFKEYRQQVYDIVFMDIELPVMNGMDAAKKLREFDKQIVIVFVTNMTQFAIRGYEVNALDYILKPVQYQSFAFKLQKAVSVIRENAEVELAVMQTSGVVRLSTKQICYIEVTGHKLLYHTGNDIISSYGSLSELEETLKNKNFLRCNNCYLVNPKFIASVKGHTVTMLNGDELIISQPKRKKFMSDLNNWLGQGNFV